MPGMATSTVSSNWKKLQETLKSDKPSTTTPKLGQKRPRPTERASGANATYQQKRPRNSEYLPSKRFNKRTMGTAASTTAAEASPPTPTGPIDEINAGLHPTHKAGRYLALDCEMVGAGPPPHADNVLARVSLVNFHGDQIYDSFVQAPAGIRVQDYRTFVSGVRAADMAASYARTFEEVQQDVTALLRGRVLVGHALRNDLHVLALAHPKRDVRDTSRYAPYRVESRGKPPALRNLAQQKLGLTIQSGAHSSVEDARATMALYRLEKGGFEMENRKRFGKAKMAASVPKAAGSDQEDDSEDEDDEEDLETLDGEDDDVESGHGGSTAARASGPARKKKGKKKKRTKRA